MEATQESREDHRRGWNWNGAGHLLVLLYVVLRVSSVVMTTEISHDEHMYLAAAKLVSCHQIYSDFAYFQTPYAPFLYSALLNASPAQHVLAVARAVKVVVVFLLAGAMWGLARLMSRDLWIACACMVMVLENSVVLGTIGTARNYDLPLLLVLLAGTLFLCRSAGQSEVLRLLLAGGLLGGAIGFKLTFALVPLAIVVPVLLEKGLTGESCRLLAALMVGVAIGFGPAAALCLRAGIETAYFNNLGYHLANAVWREQTEWATAMSPVGKLVFMKRLIATTSTQLLLVLMLSWLALAWAAKHSWSFLFANRHVCFLMCLVAVSLVMAFAPTPVWLSYYEPFVVWSSLLIAALSAEIPAAARSSGRVFACACAGLMLVMNLPGMARSVGTLVRPATWPAVRIHQEGRAIRAAIPEEVRSRPLATLSPLYALEGELSIYPELSTGPFGYRVGELLAEGQREQFRIASSERLHAMLQETPPCGVLVGFESDLEKAFEEFAIANKYEMREDVVSGGRLYLIRSGENPSRIP